VFATITKVERCNDYIGAAQTFLAELLSCESTILIQLILSVATMLFATLIAINAL
jgi:hypothetical protein